MPFRGPARLVCLISGGGRTVLNLQSAIDRGELNAEIPLVIASRPCAGVERCEGRGLSTQIVAGNLGAQALAGLLGEARADLACLAGYLRLIPVPERWRGRILNIHPALLPKFGGPGMFGDRVHRAVLEAGETESGCTVHVCDDRYDTGPVIVQRRCPVLTDDTPETLAARVFEQECIAYPEAIRAKLAELEQDAQA
ncbi:MAG: phosphoribosylglycinamide formyltransferase [Planctomycetota bacterium]